MQYREVALPVSESLATFNVKKKHSLVEVEVNDGDGSPKGSSEFLATKLTVVDQTKDYPLDVETLITESTKCYEKEIADSKKQYDRQLKRAELAALGGERKPTGPVEDALLKLPTWNSEDDTLEVTFVFSRTDGEYKYGAQDEAKKGPRHGTQFGIRTAATYVFDKDGKAKDAQMAPIALVKRELAPPAANPVAPAPVPPKVMPPVAPAPVVPKPMPPPDKK